jgi:hypothetical protein
MASGSYLAELDEAAKRNTLTEVERWRLRRTALLGAFAMPLQSSKHQLAVSHCSTWPVWFAVLSLKHSAQ